MLLNLAIILSSNSYFILPIIPILNSFFILHNQAAYNYNQLHLLSSFAADTVLLKLLAMF